VACMFKMSVKNIAITQNRKPKTVDEGSCILSFGEGKSRLGERRQLSLDSANTGGTTTCLPSLLVLNGGGGGGE
jgi:hypothetical protein